MRSRVQIPAPRHASETPFQGSLLFQVRVSPCRGLCKSRHPDKNGLPDQGSLFVFRCPLPLLAASTLYRRIFAFVTVCPLTPVTSNLSRKCLTGLLSTCRVSRKQVTVICEMTVTLILIKLPHSKASRTVPSLVRLFCWEYLSGPMMLWLIYSKCCPRNFTDKNFKISYLLIKILFWYWRRGIRIIKSNSKCSWVSWICCTICPHI